ncbi:type II toxin-antitoxin system RelE/ParE family toxin [Nitrosomonas sp.]|uniref:type II toxin-antitoxin system RelE family toxin n=1 Tax=Nitrosomonas sp. TaxID=42353 RepID=UPI002089009D|nr:type II toxin-antitoxin system RelE/ParE family toxin [Nitrosomonas sp.]GJL75077.1 MAG: hypothetical protein NMNS02_11830 [Nitrosomonas sp.]
MAKYSIAFKRSVKKDFLTIPNQDVSRILEKIACLADDPRSAGCIKLTGKELYRIRQGKYRIVYEIEDETLTVIIIKMGTDPMFILTKLDQPG